MIKLKDIVDLDSLIESLNIDVISDEDLNNIKNLGGKNIMI